MNCNAQRVTKFAMKTVTSSGDYETVAVYSILNKTITNWTVQWPFGVPLDTPSCGYDLSKCPSMLKYSIFCTIANFLFVCSL